MWFTSASFAVAQRASDTDRQGFYRTFRQICGKAFGLAGIIAARLKRAERMTWDRERQAKHMALLRARKAILAHRQDELRAQIKGARIKHGPTASLIAELQAVNLEILIIGETL